MFNIRPVRNITCIALLLLAFAPNAQAEFYNIVIKKITPQSVSGDVII